MATQVVHRGPTFESFLSSRPDPFGDSHLPEPLHAAPSLVALEIRSQVDFSQLLTPKLSMSTPIDGATPPCAASPSTKSLRNDPVEVQARSGYQEAANFVAPILEEDEPETDNQFTVTSLSGKPLLASTAAARIASRKSREKTNKKKRRQEEKEEIEALRKRFLPPDGGYGWVIAFAAFLVQFWVAGLIKSYGVIYMEIFNVFPGASASLASWIPAILGSICLVLSPVCTALCQRFSCRTVVFTGGILCWLGMSLSFFATNLVQLCFTFGVMTGFGAGLSTTPGVIMTSRYFDKHRALANGIWLSGTAAGSMAIPPLIEMLMPRYGFRGCILILGACILHVCLCAIAYRPMEIHQRITELDEKRKAIAARMNNADKWMKEDSIDDSVTAVSIAVTPPTNKMLQVPDLFEMPEDGASSIGDANSLSEQRTPRARRRTRASSMIHSMEDLSTDSTCIYKDARSLHGSSVLSLRHPPSVNNGTLQRSTAPSVTASSSACCANVNQYLDLSLVRNPLFVAMTTTVMLMAVGCPQMLFFLPAYANSVGLSKSDCSLLISISAIWDLVGRLGFGWIADLKIFPNSWAYLIGILMAGVSVLFLPLASSFTAFAIIVSLYGLGLGVWFLLVPVLLREQHGTEAIASSFGLTRLFQGITTLVIPPLIGFVKDATQDYIIGFFFMGTSMCLSAVICLLFPCIINNLKRKEEEASKNANNT